MMGGRGCAHAWMCDKVVHISTSFSGHDSCGGSEWHGLPCLHTERVCLPASLRSSRMSYSPSDKLPRDAFLLSISQEIVRFEQEENGLIDQRRWELACKDKFILWLQTFIGR